MTHAPALSPPTRTLLLAAVALRAAVLLAASGGRTPVASAATCTLSAKEGQRLGPSYVTSITATGTGCGAAKKLVKAFHACRGSQTGRCTRKVSGYRCTERRGKTLNGQFSSKVTCKRGGARVVHTYSEFV
jgi:hypothetical protein